MMKNNLFYLPILKWKTGEKRALKKLNADLKDKVVPLVEFVKKEKQAKTEDSKIAFVQIPDGDAFTEDLKFLRDNLSDMTVFVDTKLLSDLNRQTAVTTICQKVNLFEDGIYPVVYFSELEKDFNQETINLIMTKGFCLRVTGAEFAKLGTLSLESGEKQMIQLVIDLGVTDDDIETIVPVLTNPDCYKDWKSISLASGAFPKDLSEFSLDKVGKKPRQDWLKWNKIIKQLNGLGHSINYGDYTIRYPIFENLRNPNTSCSFRYTGDESWFVFRGLSRKAKNYRGHIQYRAHAVTIVDDAQYQYTGEDFSHGDMYIKSKAKLVDDKGEAMNNECGNSTTWLQAGINHHICKVVKQLNI